MSLRRVRSLGRAVALGIVAATSLACPGDPAPVIAIPAATAASSVAPKVEKDRRRTIDLPLLGRSVVSFEMSAPLEKQRATFTGGAVSGVLYLDTEVFGSSRGDVQIDLGQLHLEQSRRASVDSVFGPFTENAKQNEHAKQWLELPPEADPGQIEVNRRALVRVDYVLVDREIRNGPTFEADVRLVGSLTLHRSKQPVTVAGTVEIINSRRAPQARFRSTEPLRVDFAQFEIAPRDALGKVLERGLDAMSDKVATHADVSIDVSFAVE